MEHIQVSHPYSGQEYSIAVTDWIRNDEDAARFYRPGRRSSASVAGSHGRPSAAAAVGAAAHATRVASLLPAEANSASFDDSDDEPQHTATRQMPLPTLSQGMGSLHATGSASVPRAAATGRAGFGDASMSLDMDDSDELPMYTGSEGGTVAAGDAENSKRQSQSTLAPNAMVGATTSRQTDRIHDSFDDDDDESDGGDMVDDDEVAGMLFGGGNAMSSFKPSTAPQPRGGVVSGSGSKLGSSSGVPTRSRRGFSYDHLGVLDDDDIEDVKPTVGYGSGVSSTVASPAAVAPRSAVGTAVSSMSGTGRQSTQGTGVAGGQRTSAGRDAGWNMTVAALGLSMGDSDEMRSDGVSVEGSDDISMPDNSSYVPSSIGRRG